MKVGDRVNCVLASGATREDGSLYLVKGKTYVIVYVSPPYKASTGGCTLVSVDDTSGTPAGVWSMMRFEK